jgi:hypothetical protein
MSGETHEEDITGAIKDQAHAYLNAFRDPEKALEKLRGWMEDHYPERIRTAYWINLRTKEKDKGVEFEIYKLPYDIRLGALLGQQSAGLSISKKIIDVDKYELSLGLGYVMDIHDFDIKKASLVFVGTIKF